MHISLIWIAAHAGNRVPEMSDPAAILGHKFSQEARETTGSQDGCHGRSRPYHAHRHASLDKKNAAAGDMLVRNLDIFCAHIAEGWTCHR